MTDRPTRKKVEEALNEYDRWSAPDNREAVFDYDALWALATAARALLGPVVMRICRDVDCDDGLACRNKQHLVPLVAGLEEK